MFSGIIKEFGKVVAVNKKGDNVSFVLQSNLAKTFTVDESISHDGVCLTIEAVSGNTYQVTAIKETLDKTTLKYWEQDTLVNIEPSLKMSDVLSGHIVQGHIDAMGEVKSISEQNGSWLFTISFPKEFAHLVVEKGSICLNGISLTAFNCSLDSFTVAIIPYTYHHTNLHLLSKDNFCNIEFDIVGKYIHRFKQVQEWMK